MYNCVSYPFCIISSFPIVSGESSQTMRKLSGAPNNWSPKLWRKFSYQEIRRSCSFLGRYFLFVLFLVFFFLSGFSFTDTDDSQDSIGREGTIFFSTLPLPTAHEHSDIYLQLCMWDKYHIYLIAPLIFTRLALDRIYWITIWLIDDVTFLFVYVMIWF